jgi:hypothetical protein
MYSGITGEEFQCDIYLGVVYYQRLRHMVNDKFQVRTTGPVDPLTRQPIKVRKRGNFDERSANIEFACNRVESVPVVSVSVKWSETRFSPTEPRSSYKTD